MTSAKGKHGFSQREKYVISICAASLQGTRKRQEDCLRYGQHRDRSIAVVCDGIGGMDHGDIASRAAAETLFSDLEKVKPTDNMLSFFRYETEKLDDMVFGLRHASGIRMRAGTTATAALLWEDRLHWYSVGDSRLYLLRGSRLRCLTQAHNYAAMLEKMKETNAIDEEQYQRESGKGEWLTSYLGMGIAELFDYGSIFFPAESGERLLVCTDGLYKTVGHSQMETILMGKAEPQVISNRLQEAVRRQRCPKQDNATWIVIEGRKA